MYVPERQTGFEMKRKIHRRISKRTQLISHRPREGKNSLEVEEMLTQHLPALLLFLPLVSLFLIHTHTLTCYYTRAQAYWMLTQAWWAMPSDARGEATRCFHVREYRYRQETHGRNENDQLTSVTGSSLRKATYSKREFSYCVSQKQQLQ